MRRTPFRAPKLPTSPNYRGERLPVVLGVAVTAAIAWILVTHSVIPVGMSREPHPERRHLLWVLVGMIVVFVGGLYDDYRVDRTRGVLSQLTALRHGRVLPGVVKLAVIGAGAGFTCWMLGGRGWRFVVGTGVVAGAANLWNLLDVTPGRALKYFLPAGIGLALGARGAASTVFVEATVVAGIALVADLAEWAMLGDSGSNVLGFLVGVGAFTILTTEWLAVVLGGILALHALAETVTLSRLIERTPPLRWFDRLGRRKFDRPG